MRVGKKMHSRTRLMVLGLCGVLALGLGWRVVLNPAKPPSVLVHHRDPCLPSRAVGCLAEPGGTESRFQANQQAVVGLAEGEESGAGAEISTRDLPTPRELTAAFNVRRERPLPRPIPESSAYPGLLQVRCEDADSGAALMDVNLAVYVGQRERRPYQYGCTDAGGRCVMDLGCHPPADLWLCVDDEGYAYLEVELSSKLSKAEPPTEMTLALHPSMPLGGTVQGIQGMPAANAQIRIHEVLHESALWRPRGHDLVIFTDEKGRWRYNRFPRDVLLLNLTFYDAQRRWYSTTHRIAHPDDLAALRAGTHVLTVYEGRTRTLFIIDSDKRRIEGALVNCGEDTVVSTHDGSVELIDVPRDITRLCVEAEGYASRSWGFHEKSDFIEMQPATTYFAHVVDGEGQPVPDAEVTIGSERGKFTLWRGRTSSQGRFVWPQAPAHEKIQVKIKKPGYMKRTWRSDTDYMGQEFALYATHTVAGYVTDALSGVAVPRFEIIVKGGGEQRQIFDDVEGVYALGLEYTHLEYFVRVEAEGYHPSAAQRFTFQEGDVVRDFQLTPGGEPNGLVLNTHGDPIAGATVYATDRSLYKQGSGDFARYREVQRTDKHGVFKFVAPYCPFRHFVAMYDQGWGILTYDQLQQGEPLVLEPWAMLHGRVQLGKALPYPYRIAIQNHYQREKDGLKIFVDQEIEVDAQGYFQMERVLPGQIITEVGTQSVRSGEHLEINLGAAGRTVTGTMMVLDDPFLKIHTHDMTVITLPSTPDAPYGERYPVTVQTDGWFQIDSLPVGRYALVGRVFSLRQEKTLYRLCHSFKIDSDNWIQTAAEPQDLGVLSLDVGGLSVGDRAPSFLLKGLNQRRVFLDDYRGRVVLLCFYQQDKIPTQIQQLHERYGHTLRFTIIGIQCLGPGQMGALHPECSWSQAQTPWPSATTVAYDVRKPLPWCVLINPVGVVIGVGLRGTQLDAAIDRAFK